MWYYTDLLRGIRAIQGIASVLLRRLLHRVHRIIFNQYCQPWARRGMTARLSKRISRPGGHTNGKTPQILLRTLSSTHAYSKVYVFSVTKVAKSELQRPRTHHFYGRRRAHTRTRNFRPSNHVSCSTIICKPVPLRISSWHFQTPPWLVHPF